MPMPPDVCIASRCQVRRAAWKHHADTYLITLEGWSPVEAGKGYYHERSVWNVVPGCHVKDVMYNIDTNLDPEIILSVDLILCIMHLHSEPPAL